MKIINFIPVQTLGSPRAYPAALGSYTGLGNVGASVTMPKRDVQRALIAAGKLAAGGDDGIFGPISQRAMRSFADSLPQSSRLPSVTWGSSSYRNINTRDMALPSAWASALRSGPATSGGGAATTGGGAATTGGASTPALLPDGTPAGGAPPSGGGPVGIPERPSVPTTGGGQPAPVGPGGGAATTGGGAATTGGGAATTGRGGPAQNNVPGPSGQPGDDKPRFLTPEGSGGGGRVKKEIPWMWIGVGAAGLVAVGAVVLLSRRT